MGKKRKAEESVEVAKFKFNKRRKLKVDEIREEEDLSNDKHISEIVQ